MFQQTYDSPNYLYDCRFCEHGYIYDTENKKCVQQYFCNTTDYRPGYNYYWQLFGVCLCGKNEYPQIYLNTNYQSNKYDIKDYSYYSYGCVTSNDDYINNCHLLIELFLVDVAITKYYCGACKPGFKGATNAERPYFFDSCIEISNCDVDLPTDELWIGGCSKCNPGYGFKLFSDKVINECISTTAVNNCFVVGNIKLCSFCDLNYKLIDDQCVQVLTPGCESSTDVNHNSILKLRYNHYYIPVAMTFDAYVGMYGCQKCSDNNFVLYKYQSSRIICVTPIEDEYYTNVVDKCKFYGYDFNGGNFICTRCSDGYALEKDRRSCFQNDDFCVHYDEIENKCLECRSDKSLKDNKCVDPVISNCAE